MPLFHGAINHALKRTIKREKNSPACIMQGDKYYLPIIRFA
ncbi:hypothetical protein [Ottowia sp. oral taxon 894]|nr:hypothetical protein [Ottowia sp. oral taxon 894]